MALVLRLQPGAPESVCALVAAALRDSGCGVLRAPAAGGSALLVVCVDVAASAPAASAHEVVSALARLEHVPATPPLLDALSAASRAHQAAPHPAGPSPAAAHHHLPALLPLLARRGVLAGVFPLHNAAAVKRLAARVKWGLLAPVEAVRHYAGEPVAWHAAFLNAAVLWLLAPAAASLGLSWSRAAQRAAAAGSAAAKAAAGASAACTAAAAPELFSPAVPLLTFVQLLWAAAGLRLWLREQATLQLRWGAPSSDSSDSREPELRAPALLQLARLGASLAGTAGLLAAAGALLMACLNVQGQVAPQHSAIFIPRLAALSLGVFAPDAGPVLCQVPMLLRVLATAAFSSAVYSPAARWLTALENHRTHEGFAASLTCKLAALTGIFTFVLLAYIGLAGAGAAAVRADVAAFFRVEPARRVAMEVLLPWASSLLAAWRARRARARASAAGARSPAAASTLPAAAVPLALAEAALVAQALDEASKLPVNLLEDTADVVRDIGYALLFGAVFLPAAPLVLLFTLAKVKQDCLKLLHMCQRPLPQPQPGGLGSWTLVLAAQVLAAVVTTVFLSGLSSGQLAQLLPAWLVPPPVRRVLLAAAVARPTSSALASRMGTGRTAWPPTHSFVSHEGSPAAAGVCPVPQAPWGFAPPAAVCAAPVPAPAGALAVGGVDAGAAHVALLFGLEHVLLLAMLLVAACVPVAPRQPAAPSQAPKAAPAVTAG